MKIFIFTRSCSSILHRAKNSFVGLRLKFPLGRAVFPYKFFKQRAYFALIYSSCYWKGGFSHLFSRSTHIVCGYRLKRWNHSEATRDLIFTKFRQNAHSVAPLSRSRLNPRNTRKFSVKWWGWEAYTLPFLPIFSKETNIFHLQCLTFSVLITESIGKLIKSA